MFGIGPNVPLPTWGRVFASSKVIDFERTVFVGAGLDSEVVVKALVSEFFDLYEKSSAATMKLESKKTASNFEILDYEGNVVLELRHTSVLQWLMEPSEEQFTLAVHAHNPATGLVNGAYLPSSDNLGHVGKALSTICTNIGAPPLDEEAQVALAISMMGLARRATPGVLLEDFLPCWFVMKLPEDFINSLPDDSAHFALPEYVTSKVDKSTEQSSESAKP